MDSTDVARLERLIAASVAYRAACEALDEADERHSAGPLWNAAKIAHDNAANEVLAAAEAIHSPSRLTDYEAGVLTAARAYRAKRAAREYCATEYDNLTIAALQPEEAPR